MISPKLGDVWLIDLNPSKGHEQAGLRPALIVSVDEFNNCPADLIVALPITTKQRDIPTRIRLSPPEGGLKKTSFIICEQIRTVSKERLKRRLGKVRYDTLNQARDCISMILGL